MAPKKQSSGAGSSSAKQETVRQTIVETVEAPRLTNLGTSDFVEFKRKREVYEQQIAEKNEEQGVSIPLTSYRNSISKPLLEVLLIAKWVPVNSLEDLTEQHLKDCVEKRARVPPADYDLAQIERGLRHVKMDVNEKALAMQVWKLCLQYKTALENLGYAQFINTQPKLAIGHIVKRITNENLRKRMLLTIKLKKEEGFNKNFAEFMQELEREAKIIDRQEAASGFKGTLSDTEHELEVESKAGIDRPRRAKRKKHSKHPTATGSSAFQEISPLETGSQRALLNRKRSREPPPCLNPRCSKRHFIIDCEMTSPEERKKLLDEYHASRKKPRDEQKKPKSGKILSIENNDTYRNPSLFSASFCAGAVEATVLADQGSDADIIPPNVLKKIQACDPKLKVHNLDRVMLFTTYDKTAPPVACSRKMKATVMLRVRHGTNLVMRNMDWLVSDKESEYVIIGKRVLAALGLDNREMLASACDKHEGAVDVPETLRAYETKLHTLIGMNEHNASGINCLLNERDAMYGSMYHSEGGKENDYLEDARVYVDLGEDAQELLAKELADQVEAAIAAGLSKAGAARLAQLFKKFESIFGSGWENPHQPKLIQCGCALIQKSDQ